MGKYRKLPVEVEAIQWLPLAKSYDKRKENKEAVEAFCSNGGTREIRFELNSYHYDDGLPIPPYYELYIKTLEGEMKASHGDYIIRGVSGEFYPCKENIFHQTYEKVED